MQPSAPRSYLVTEVLTATPQKLQLMLIDAALRSAGRARQHWQEGRQEQACEAMIHAQQVVGELLGALDHEIQPELTRKVAGIYLFVFRSLTEANLRGESAKLDDAIRVLREERETWRQVCEKLSGEAPADSHADTASLTLSPANPTPTPHAPVSPDLTCDAGPMGGISLEA